MPVDTHVLGMDIRYFFVAYAIAVGAAFVPADLVVLRYVAVAALIGIYAWYVKIALRGRHHRLTPWTSRRCASGASIAVAYRTDPRASRACASSTCRSWSRWR